jgi:hypothetical protein
MIPTQFKAKLPGTLSWPVGAEAVTAGLADAPHAAEFTLWFVDSPVWRASEFQKTLRTAQPYAVLVAEYNPAMKMPYSRSAALDQAGHYNANWRIQINPVPRAWRAKVAALLRENGLPAVADWLRSIDTVGWQDRFHRLELIFAPIDGNLSRNRRDGV